MTTVYPHGGFVTCVFPQIYKERKFISLAHLFVTGQKLGSPSCSWIFGQVTSLASVGHSVLKRSYMVQNMDLLATRDSGRAVSFKKMWVGQTLSTLGMLVLQSMSWYRMWRKKIEVWIGSSVQVLPWCFCFKYMRTMENSHCLLSLPCSLVLQCCAPCGQPVLFFWIIKMLSLFWEQQSLLQRWLFVALFTTVLNLWGRWIFLDAKETGVLAWFSTL